LYVGDTDINRCRQGYPAEGWVDHRSTILNANRYKADTGLPSSIEPCLDTGTGLPGTLSCPDCSLLYLLWINLRKLQPFERDAGHKPRLAEDKPDDGFL